MFAFSPQRVKAVLAATVVALMSCIGLALYWHYLFVFYPEHAVTGFMGAEDHRTIAKRHSEFDWYIAVAIPSSRGEALLRQHSFQAGYDPQIPLPKIPSPDIKACTACWSYFEGKDHGVYGYVLAVLSPDKQSLQLYENFGE
jgi:hypothetical protein